jgi:hypothetical protein
MNHLHATMAECRPLTAIGSHANSINLNVHSFSICSSFDDYVNAIPHSCSADIFISFSTANYSLLAIQV